MTNKQNDYKKSHSKSQSPKSDPIKNPRSLFLISIGIICSLYIIFHACISEMVIAHDAEGYEQSGQTLLNHGLIEYIKAGPNREPLYPLSIAASMFLAKKLTVSYQTIQIIFQLLIFSLTLILTLKILKKLKVSDPISGFVILYMTFSPAFFNTSVCLFSEILTYPFILIFILMLFKAIIYFQQNKYAVKETIILGTLLGLSFTSLIFIKALFEVLLPFFLIPFALYLFSAFKKKDRNLCKHTAIFLLIFITIPLGTANIYKSLNKKLNGQFVLADRGPLQLYGNITQRMEPLTFPRLKARFASLIPSSKFCQSLCGKDDCMSWSWLTADNYSAHKVDELIKGSTNEQINKTLTKLAFEKIMNNPIQFLFLSLIETSKFFFWENPSMQYVFYPTLVVKMISFKPINKLLYIVPPILFMINFLFTMIFLIKNTQTSEETTLLKLIVLFIAAFLFGYSLVNILPRYILPLVPLQMILLGFMFEKMKNRLGSCYK